MATNSRNFKVKNGLDVTGNVTVSGTTALTGALTGSTGTFTGSVVAGQTPSSVNMISVTGGSGGSIIEMYPDGGVWGVGIRVPTGGWSRSFSFWDQARTVSLGGFGGYGSGDTLSYLYAGTSYNSAYATKFYPTTGNVTVPGVLTNTNTTDSTSSTNGSVVLSGGMGVSKNLNVGWNINSYSSVANQRGTNPYFTGLAASPGLSSQTGASVIQTTLPRTTSGMYVVHVHGWHYAGARIDFTIRWYQYQGLNDPNGNPGVFYAPQLIDLGTDTLTKRVGMKGDQVFIAIGDTTSNISYLKYTVDCFFANGAPTEAAIDGWSVATNNTTSPYMFGADYEPIALTNQAMLMVQNTAQTFSGNKTFSGNVTLSGEVAGATQFNNNITIGKNNGTDNYQLLVRKGVGAATSLTRDNMYAHFGGIEWGANKNFALGFGYTAAGANYPPAVLAFQEISSGASTYGDFVFYSRSVGSNIEATERLRISGSGNATTVSGELKVRAPSGNFGLTATASAGVYQDTLTTYTGGYAIALAALRDYAGTLQNGIWANGSYTSGIGTGTSIILGTAYNDANRAIFTSAGIFTLSATTESGNTANGTLVVGGGAGIGKRLFVGGYVRVEDTTDATSTTTGSIVASGGVGVAKSLHVGTGATILAPANGYALTLDTSYSDGGTNTWRIGPTASGYTAGDNKFVFLYNTTSSGSSMLTLDGPNNRIGIKQNNPQTDVDINGTVRVTTASGTGWFNGGGVLFETQTTFPAFGSLGFGIYNTASGIQIGKSSNPFLTIDPNGNAGFGTTAPVARVHANTGAAGTKGIIVRGAAAQTANLQEWQDSASTVLASLDAGGNFTAVTKSFDIEHPTKPGKRLRYGSLEGPENGVYVRGRSSSDLITFPDYWQGLVDPDSITVQLTPLGAPQPDLYVVSVSASSAVVNHSGEYFFLVMAERSDVDRLVVEYGD